MRRIRRRRSCHRRESIVLRRAGGRDISPITMTRVIVAAVSFAADLAVLLLRPSSISQTLGRSSGYCAPRWAVETSRLCVPTPAITYNFVSIYRRTHIEQRNETITRRVDRPYRVTEGEMDYSDASLSAARGTVPSRLAVNGST